MKFFTTTLALSASVLVYVPAAKAAPQWGFKSTLISNDETLKVEMNITDYATGIKASDYSELPKDSGDHYIVGEIQGVVGYEANFDTAPIRVKVNTNQMYYYEWDANDYQNQCIVNIDFIKVQPTSVIDTGERIKLTWIGASPSNLAYSPFEEENQTHCNKSRCETLQLTNLSLLFMATSVCTITLSIPHSLRASGETKLLSGSGEFAESS